jgi:hypothetical protein
VESVWCTRCGTKLPALHRLVFRHFQQAHRVKPTQKEIEWVLINLRIRGRARARRVPKSDPPVRGVRRRARFVSGGLPSLGKRR